MSKSYKKYESLIVALSFFIYWTLYYWLIYNFSFKGYLDILFFLLIGAFLIFSVGLIYYFFWKYLWKSPLYKVTSEQLIKKERNFWGKWKLKSINIPKINTIYIIKSKFYKYSFIFLQNSIEEIIQQHPAPIRQIIRVVSSIGNTLRSRSKENLIQPLDYSAQSISDWDYRAFQRILTLIRKQILSFDSVDSPKTLFKALRSLIQLKKHPTLSNAYIQDN